MINDEFNYPSWLYDPQLVIPATFEECLTYEMQVIWLYKKIEALGDGGGSDAIKQLQDEVAALAVRVDKNSQDITESKADVASLEDEIGNLRVTVESYDERINIAVTLAQGADRTATIATNTANEAKETADGIKATADEALANAATATETATEAKNTADSVKSTADNAITTANAAKSTADEAKFAAASAEETADSALSNISTVMSAVNRAQRTADNAAAEAAALGTSKQDKLVAGDNINIDGNVISATGGGSGGTSNYYELQNRPFLQEIDLSTTSPSAPLDLDTLAPGAYMLKGTGQVKNDAGGSNFITVHSGPMFLYPSSNPEHCDALFITNGETIDITANISNLYNMGRTNIKYYPYGMGVTSRPYGIQALTDVCIANYISSTDNRNYVASTQAVKLHVNQRFKFNVSYLFPTIPIPVAGSAEADNYYDFRVNSDLHGIELYGIGTFSTSESMVPTTTTIELGPLTADAFLAIGTYRINPPDHFVVYSVSTDEVPYAMYWYDKVEPASTDKPWTWKYQYNDAKSIYSGKAGTDDMITLPDDGAAVESFAIF